MNIYTRIDGKTAMYTLDTEDPAVARETVLFEIGRTPGSKLVKVGPILAVVDGGVREPVAA